MMAESRRPLLYYIIFHHSSHVSQMPDSNSNEHFFIGFLAAFCGFILLFLTITRLRHTHQHSPQVQHASPSEKPKLYEPPIVGGGHRWADMMPLSVSSQHPDTLHIAVLIFMPSQKTSTLHCYELGLVDVSDSLQNSCHSL